MTTLRQAAQQALMAHTMLRDWIKAVPQEVVLPAMPGIDGDWLDEVESNLRAELEQPEQEPLGWLDGTDKLAEFMHRDLKADHDKRGSATPREFTVPVYLAPPLPQQQAEPSKFLIEKIDEKLLLNGKEIGPGTIEVRLDGLTYRAAKKVEVEQPEHEPVAWVEQSGIDWLTSSKRDPTAYLKTMLSKRKGGLSTVPLYTAPPAAQPAPTQVDITIEDDDALSYLRDMVVQSDGELTPIRLLVGDGHSGRGLYIASADYPDEGAIKIADVADTPPAARPEPRPVGCECHRCIKEHDLRMPGRLYPLNATKMILCPTCGNKRCPKASDHRLDCTDSNESGQPGSVYTNPPPKL